MKFLSIFGSNIDEFFMVRVAGLTQQIENGVQEPGIDGRGPSETLEAIRSVVGRLVSEAYEFLREDLIPALEANHIRLLNLADLSLEQRAQLDTFFCRQGISGADAAGLRSGPSVSAHFEPQPEYRGGGARARRTGTFRARQGSRHVAAVAPGRAAARAECQRRANTLSFGWSS